jgi:transketolase
MATGSEVQLALAAREVLEKQEIKARVVSMPCWELFEEQQGAYRDYVLGPGTARVAVEAGCRLGWDRYLGPFGQFVGMKDFGASAPAEKLYAHFGITTHDVVEAAHQALGAH